MAMNQGDYPDWAELPPELTSSILHRLGGIEILENAQRVCTSWRRVCKDPSMWRKIDMSNPHRGDSCHHELDKMCHHAVDRSQGALVEIEIWRVATYELLSYIADRSSNLRSLKLALCYQIASEGLREILVKLPLLEVLETSYCALSAESVKVIGQSCPNLKSFGKNCEGYRRPRNECDDLALAIAETMPGLTRLQLFGNRLTDVGLKAILDGCPNLEYLDLRQCFNVNLVGDLEKRCSERIRVVRRPDDSTHDYPFDATVHDMDSSEDDDYLYDISDEEDDIAPADEFDDDLSGASDHSDLDHFD
ncbi:F-box protein SKIP19 [Raphanus sativus]|uniref:F-box protein SKIP19-like n=1 Tax=Raphanus sativus TaxID=3726 RepID=A0A6J0KUC0_RAPSA|nr:F-box protein SKIP19-like [Raphanus sativus]KAJ4878958.1 F-box protein SKIP19 [Raphanus sativus]